MGPPSPSRGRSSSPTGILMRPSRAAQSTSKGGVLRLAAELEHVPHHCSSVGVATPTWLGTMSTSTPSPSRRASADSAARPLGAAAGLVDAVVGDHVVAVVAAGLGGQQRREVDPVDAEVAQVLSRPRAVCRSKSSVICRRYVDTVAGCHRRGRGPGRGGGAGHQTSSGPPAAVCSGGGGQRLDRGGHGAVGLGLDVGVLLEHHDAAPGQRQGRAGVEGLAALVAAGGVDDHAPALGVLTGGQGRVTSTSSAQGWK